MGSQELLLYPINDGIIRSLDWDDKKVYAIYKKDIIRKLGVSEPMFIDALLMAGTAFLPTFPPILDHNVNPRNPSVQDAVNMLRTADKSVAGVCNAFNDVLQATDPQWLDKYQKARMAVNHFIYIAESGEVKVHEWERLTGDNHEYLGLQLPSELFHYLNTGLISPRVLNWITHCKTTVLPTTDGVVTPEYRQLVTKQLVPFKEMALSLIIPRLNRGIQHREIILKVWYDNQFSQTVYSRNSSVGPTVSQSAGWNITEALIKSHFPNAASGSLTFELSALKNKDFATATATKDKTKPLLETGNTIVSTVIWKFLHLRGYVTDSHELSPWGKALYNAFASMKPTIEKYPDVPGLYEAVLLGFELIRLDLLHGKNRHDEVNGLPLNGSEDDKTSLLLISRCATLLKLRHQPFGYTGPLSKNLLTFHSLTAAVRDADRDLVDAIVASLFLDGQAQRERSDYWEISHR